jgi:hypothetical protein
MVAIPTMTGDSIEPARQRNDASIGSGHLMGADADPQLKQGDTSAAALQLSPSR